MLEKKRYFLKFYVLEEEPISWCKSDKSRWLLYYNYWEQKNSLKKTDGSFQKHKIYLYKEDFFAEILGDMTAYVLNHKGEEVISETSERFQKRI
jgi:hypothetical protein